MIPTHYSQLPLPDLTLPISERRMRRRKQFGQIMRRANALLIRKNEEYGDAFAETGLLGTATELVGNSARIRELVLRTSDHGRSQQRALTDKLLDVLGYAILCLVCLDDQNWEGIDE